MGLRRPKPEGTSSTSQSGPGAGRGLLLGGQTVGLALAGLVLLSCFKLTSTSTTDAMEPAGDAGSRMPQAQGAHTAPMATGADAQAMVDRYCVRCHNDVRRTAFLELDQYDATNPAAHPEIWEKVVTKLRAGAMPPGGVRRPAEETYDAVASWLESELDAAWAENPNVGRINAVHRLNRTEYNNAVNDLLALDVNVIDQVPGDETMGGGFDNVADALSISPLHMERYMSVARTVTRLAVGLPPAGAGSFRYAADDAKRQNVRMGDDLPLGSRGGMAIHHTFPVDGEYRIRVRLQKNYAGYARGLGWKQELDVRIDGELVDRLVFGGEGRQHRPVANSYAGAGGGPGWPGSPEWENYAKFGAEAPLMTTVRVGAGSRVVGLSFTKDLAYGEEYLLPQAPVQTRSQIDYFNNEYFGMSGVIGMEIDGPFGNTEVADNTRSREGIFICEPESASEEEACATEILTRMAWRAYRRPVTQEDMEVLLRFFDIGREEGGSFDHGIQLGLERILIDPDFILRVYREPGMRATDETPDIDNPDENPALQSAAGQEAQALAQGDPYSLSDLEIASRLSFFLWSSVPDDTLLQQAEEGRLTDPEVLREQAWRMLNDPRARETLVEDFASQWLKLRELDDRLLQDDIYLEYDHNLREAMEEETRLFFEYNIREDRSVVELLNADYTFVSERLAEHYNIPDVAGSHFRRVQLPDLEKRGGLLGHASILTVTSYPERTTPVLRGKWILETILGRHVPPPPPDLDTSLEIPEDQGAVRQPTIRERLARHRTEPTCASCHRTIDPLGFSLEAYDAAGGLRLIDELGNPVDNTGLWPETEQEIQGLAGLRNLILENKEQFVRTVTTKLMQYALGRDLEYYDQPAIRKIMRDAEAENYTWSSIILGIVESPQFLKRMSAATTPTAEQSALPHMESGEDSNGLHHR